MGKVSKLFIKIVKDSDEEDKTYIVHSSSCSPIYSRQVSITRRNYVHIPKISCSVLGLYPMKRSRILIDWNCAKRGLEKHIFTKLIKFILKLKFIPKLSKKLVFDKYYNNFKYLIEYLVYEKLSMKLSIKLSISISNTYNT